MKKIILSAITMAVAGVALAQPDPAFTNKRGVQLLPQTGDWGLGVNAVPFLNYLGNALNNSNSNTVNFGFLNADQTIFGKYFITDQKAFRGSARIGYSSMTTTNFVRSMEPGLVDNFVEDSRTTDVGNYLLSGGLEFRRGRGRVQGYYGAEAFVGFSTRVVNYEYGNEFTPDNPSVFFTNNFNTGTSIQGSDRIVEDRAGASTVFGVRGFVGVEYFIAPQISLAGEFGWGPAFMVQGEGRQMRERINNNALETRALPRGRENGLSIDNDNLSGSIALMFYF